MTIRRQLVLWFLVHERNWLSASSSSSCTRCSHDGATIVGEARWAGLYVVIRGAHQPRYPEATCQYFGQLLHQLEGYGAEREDRLVYGEGLCDVNTALDLLARHIVDQRASNLLFGDRRRLQEDLLAGAANAEVRKLFPKARGCPSGAHRRAR